jgi:hypothetical protein
LSRVVTAELHFLSANPFLCRRGDGVGRDRALKRKWINATTGFLVVNAVTNTVQLIHQKVELILYLFQTVFLAGHAVLSVRNTRIGVRNS